MSCYKILPTDHHFENIYHWRDESLSCKEMFCFHLFSEQMSTAPTILSDSYNQELMKGVNFAQKLPVSPSCIFPSSLVIQTSLGPDLITEISP